MKNLENTEAWQEGKAIPLNSCYPALFTLSGEFSSSFLLLPLESDFLKAHPASCRSENFLHIPEGEEDSKELTHTAHDSMFCLKPGLELDHRLFCCVFMYFQNFNPESRAYTAGMTSISGQPCCSSANNTLDFFLALLVFQD